jgi:branched-chain amino acid aminotransferase
MHRTPLYKYFIFNGELKPNILFKSSENAGGIYEVLRVAEGIPLFLEEHLERFFSSAVIAGKSIRFQKEQIISFLNALIHQNNVQEGNILLSCKTNLKAFFIPHEYPKQEWYETGVRCGLLYAERPHPNAKVFQTSVRQQADRLIKNKGYYEVLLVDHLERVTEGSRSNVFFVKENRMITPPGDEVLRGITRQKIIQLATDSGIPFSEQEVWLKDLPAFEAAFITGTSPKILPLSQIEERKLNPQNSLMQKLRKQYDDLVMDYLRANQ